MVEQLRSQLRRWETRSPDEAEKLVSTGFAELDRLLPEGGLKHGSLVEWLSAAGSGAGTLALAAARQTLGQGGPLVVVDRAGEFYPAAAALAGIEWSDLIVLRPRSVIDETWAVDQSLRSPAVGAVLCWTRQADARTRRRWQLSAETGQTFGLLVCPERVRGHACWAAVRWLIEPMVSMPGRRVRATLLYCRSGAAGGQVELELIDEARAMSETARVAPATLGRRWAAS